MSLLTLFGSRGRTLRDDFDALAGFWQQDVGTATVSGGALRGATLGDALLNLISNGEFTTDIAGWSANAASLSQVTSTAQPGVSSVLSGALDAGCLRAEKTGASSWARQTKDVVIGAAYRVSALCYSPSLNTAENVAGVGTSSALGWETTAARVQVRLSDDGGTTYRKLYDRYGTLYTVVAAASRAVALEPVDMAGVTHIKLLGATAVGTAAAQSTAVTVGVVVRLV